MKIEKQWYSLREVADELGCPLEHLFYLCISGKLIFSFDWLILKEEFDFRFDDFPSVFEFNEVIDSYEDYYGDDCVTCETTIPIEMSSIINGIGKRFSNLTPNQVGLLKKHKKIKIKSAQINEIQFYNIKLPNECTDFDYPKVSIDDVVVTSESLISFQKHIEETSLSILKRESVNEALNTDKISDALYVANCLFREIWPIPIDMKKPTKLEIIQIIEDKGHRFTKATIESILRLCTPGDFEFGGQSQKSKRDFDPSHKKNSPLLYPPN